MNIFSSCKQTSAWPIRALILNTACPRSNLLARVSYAICTLCSIHPRGGLPDTFVLYLCMRMEAVLFLRIDQINNLIWNMVDLRLNFFSIIFKPTSSKRIQIRVLIPLLIASPQDLFWAPSGVTLVIFAVLRLLKNKTFHPRTLASYYLFTLRNARTLCVCVARSLPILFLLLYSNVAVCVCALLSSLLLFIPPSYILNAFIIFRAIRVKKMFCNNEKIRSFFFFECVAGENVSPRSKCH